MAYKIKAPEHPQGNLQIQGHAPLLGPDLTAKEKPMHKTRPHVQSRKMWDAQVKGLKTNMGIRS